MLSRLLLFFAGLSAPALAFKPLSDNFLRLIPAATDVDQLLVPLLQPRVSGTPGHAAVQSHLVSFFQSNLPDWMVDWVNTTAEGERPDGTSQHLVFSREPPWTRAGQANFLTLAAHYDTPATAPEGFVGAADAAVSCALLLHVARSLDRFVSQMYSEMQELGEGGTVPMDMGLQVVFMDQASSSDVPGSAQLAAAWERRINPARTASLYGYPNQLNQISLFVLLNLLGPAQPRVPSRYQTTHWAYAAMATVERRLADLELLESRNTTAFEATPFLPDSQTPVHQIGVAATGWATDDDDHIPFMERGITALPVVPDSQSRTFQTLADDLAHVDLPTVRDWSRILTGFVLEWLDMMEVEPQRQR